MVQINLKDFYGQGCIGIQFTSQYLLIAELQRGFREIVLKDYKIKDLDGVKEEPSALAREIRDFVSSSRSSLSSNYVIGIPREKTLVKDIGLPMAVEENIAQVIQYELERYIPFTSEEVYYDYQIIERDTEENQLRILLVAVKKDTLEYYLEILKEAQIEPIIVEISSTALLNTILFNDPYSDNELRAAIQIGGSTLEFLLIQGKTLRYSRVLTLNGDLASPIKTELEHALWLGGYESDRGDNLPIKELIVNGDWAEGENNLSQILSPQFKIDTRVFNPLNKIKIFHKAHHSLPPNLVYPIGLALRGVDKGGSKINLLPIGLRKKKKKGSLTTTLVLLGLIILLGISNLSTYLIKERRLLTQLENRLAQLKVEVSSIEQQQKEADEIAKEINFFNSIKRSQPSKLEILKELTTILPDDAWLTNLTFNENKVIINGFASSASSLIPLLDKSPLFQEVEFVSPITKGRELSERFKIKLELEAQ
jgi:general secretion pathway protein L